MLGAWTKMDSQTARAISPPSGASSTRKMISFISARLSCARNLTPGMWRPRGAGIRQGHSARKDEGNGKALDPGFPAFAGKGLAGMTAKAGGEATAEGG